LHEEKKEKEGLKKEKEREKQRAEIKKAKILKLKEEIKANKLKIDFFSTNRTKFKGVSANEVIRFITVATLTIFLVNKSATPSFTEKKQGFYGKNLLILPSNLK
jgi:hypothetical protein